MLTFLQPPWGGGGVGGGNPRKLAVDLGSRLPSSLSRQLPAARRRFLDDPGCHPAPRNHMPSPCESIGPFAGAPADTSPCQFAPFSGVPSVGQVMAPGVCSCIHFPREPLAAPYLFFEPPVEHPLLWEALPVTPPSTRHPLYTSARGAVTARALLHSGTPHSALAAALGGGRNSRLLQSPASPC